MKQLVQLRESVQAIAEAGGSIVAISVDTPAQSTDLLARMASEGTALTFPLACDPSRESVKAFGVFDVAHDIALPSTLILAADGSIAWKYVGGSVFDRPTGDAVVAALRALKK